MLPISVIPFIVKYKKPIVYSIGAALVVAGLYFAIAAVLDSYYQKGKSEADKVWIKKYNKDVTRQNKRIDELEALSTKGAERLRQVRDTATLFVDASVKKWKTLEKEAGDKVKVTVKCPAPSAVNTPTSQAPQEVQLQLDTKDLVLPPGYIKTWNTINEVTQ